MNINEILDDNEEIIYCSKKNFVSFSILFLLVLFGIYGCYIYDLNSFQSLLMYIFFLIALFAFISEIRKKYILTSHNLIEIKFYKIKKYPLISFDKLIISNVPLLYIGLDIVKGLYISFNNSDEGLKISPFIKVVELKNKIELVLNSSVKDISE